MAAGALHMIVLGQHVVIAVGRSGHGYAPQEAAFHEGIQIPVYRPFADIGIVQDNTIIYFFCCRVIAERADGRNDQLPLDCIPFLKHRHLLHSFSNENGNSFSLCFIFSLPSIKTNSYLDYTKSFLKSQRQDGVQIVK
jgi:hypothetical protein